MVKFRNAPVLLIVVISIIISQLSCGGALPNLSGGGNNTTGNARPAPHFTPGFNLFSPEQDVELGRQSAQQIAQQVPLMRDEKTVGYIRQ
ncbi:MAG: hypothetical protein H0T92_24760, partial [Pyrinomonadaceae bacterium]|nr:hypothetical protein [Pyrinomonadaceae bacterium]